MNDVASTEVAAVRSAADYKSKVKPIWCPGCGDYAILATVQRTLAQKQIPRENYVFISGIGCSSRFPGRFLRAQPVQQADCGLSRNSSRRML